MAIAYLNGDWSAPEDARISVFDRGFMFGDGIYEVMPVYHGKVFTEDEHLARLNRSLGEIHLASPHTDEQWRALFAEGIRRGGEDPALLYLQVTRGVAAKRDHVWPDVPPTVLMTITPAPQFARTDIKPFRMVTKKDIRWSRGDIKVVSLIANGLLRNEAIAEGYDDAILIRDGLVTEATAANVFAVIGGVIVTPPKSHHLLHGITRDVILSLAASKQMRIEQRAMREAELLAADEVWISSTGNEIWPVGEINDAPVADGQPGPVFAAIDELYQAAKAERSD